MNLSVDRILTTHVGSMPRSQPVVDMLFAEDRGEAVDRAAYDATMAEAVSSTVAQQRNAGVDIPSDGEMTKISYATYIRHRFTGFAIGEAPRATPQDLDDFPDYKRRLAQSGTSPRYQRPICRGPIAIQDMTPLHKEIAHLQRAMQVHGVEEAFLNAASPGVIAVFQPNEYYNTNEAYLQALAEVMKVEYEAIVNAGLLLQVDCPDLAMGRHIRFRAVDDAEFLRHAELQVEALNYALSAIPSDRVRMHLCWGNYDGPHTRDIALDKIIHLVLKAKPQAILFEAANPRHAHEWKVWTEVTIPEDKVLVPGVIESTNNFIEHPELVAQRIEQFAAIVGRERVLAGSDCGFGTFAGYGAVDPQITFGKLAALAEGAQLASARLW